MNSNQIVRLPGSSSFVFSLHAAWGEGKTSVLNLLMRRLNAHPRMIPIVFNPWYLATESALIQAFYADVERELQKRYIVVGLRKTLGRYRNLLSSGLRSLGVRLEIPIHDDPERLRQDLESWVERTGCRLVILIDDIDRLRAPEVLSVFKLAALSARLRKTVFLLSFDHILIREMLEHTAKVDPDFLEKVIQKPLQLPPVEHHHIDRFLLSSDSEGSESRQSAMDELLGELEIEAGRLEDFKKNFSIFYRMYLSRLFRTLRQVKRYINSIRATLPSVVGEVDLYDFMLLEVIRVFFPKAYQDIWQHPWYYVPHSMSEMVASPPVGFAHNEDEKSRHIREHIESLLPHEQTADVLKRMLQELFFIELGRAFQWSFIPIRRQTSGTYRADKRLTDPDCFPKYFLFRIPQREIPDQTVEELIRQWNEAHQSSIEKLVEDTVREYQALGKLVELLIALRIFTKNVSRTHMRAIIRGLYCSAPLMDRNAIFVEGSEYQLLEKLILFLIEEQAEPQEIQSILEEVIIQVPDLYFVVQIVLLCHGKPRRDLNRIYNHSDRTTLRKLAAQRLYDYYVRDHRDIFGELAEEEWGNVLYQWGTDWMTAGPGNRIIVQEYVLGLIDDTPPYLGQLLRHFIDRGFGQQAGGFRFDDFCQLYDPAMMLERLNRHGDGALMTAETRQAAEIFRQAYFDSRSPKTGADSQGHEAW